MTAQEAAKSIANASSQCLRAGCIARKIGTEPDPACVKDGCLSRDYVPAKTGADVGYTGDIAPKTLTRGADVTQTALIEFDPDTHEPKTIRQLAQEQREFVKSLPGDMVDIELPADGPSPAVDWEAQEPMGPDDIQEKQKPS